MRVAALYDVHGNLPALEAVLAEVERTEVDVVLVGGDVVAGPLPQESLAALRALGGRARFIRGNADRSVVEADRGESPPEDLGSYAAATLTAEEREFIAAWPETAVLDVDSVGATLFCHGSPRSDEEMITVRTTDEALAEMLAGVEQPLVVCGHTHMQFDRTVGSTRVVNAGSVGMPYADRPGAYWALLGPGVELRRTEYPLEAAAEVIRRSGWPGATEFAAENVVSPPSADEALDVFHG